TVSIPTALLRIAGASNTRDCVRLRPAGSGDPPRSDAAHLRDPDDMRRMIEEALLSSGAGAAGSGAPSSARSDLCIAVLESAPVSTPAATFSAASRAAAASV